MMFSAADITFHQPPPFATPPTDSILETSDEHALPHSPSPTGGIVQRDKARNILQTVLDTADGKVTGSNPSPSPEDVCIVGNDPLLNTECLRRDDLVVTSSGSQSTKRGPSTDRINIAGGKTERSVAQDVCDCTRSALFSMDEDDDDDDDDNTRVTKHVNQNLCRTCGKRKTSTNVVAPSLSSSSEALSALSPPSNHHTFDDVISTPTNNNAPLQEQNPSSHSTTTTNLAGTDSSSSPSAVKRKTLHKRSQSDVQLSGRVGGSHGQGVMNRSSADLSSSLPEEGRSATNASRRGSFLENGELILSPSHAK